jgi:hypothetical protein
MCVGAQENEHAVSGFSSHRFVAARGEAAAAVSFKGSGASTSIKEAVGAATTMSKDLHPLIAGSLAESCIAATKANCNRNGNKRGLLKKKNQFRLQPDS